jgi:hypothetical protein
MSLMFFKIGELHAKCFPGHFCVQDLRAGPRGGPGILFGCPPLWDLGPSTASLLWIIGAARASGYSLCYRLGALLGVMYR